MEKTLLGIIGSPRKFGNSEVFAKEVYRNMPQGWRLRLIRLPELDIRPCRGCYQCLYGEMRCPQDDDFQSALDALVSADATVVAAPTYFLGANSSLKRFLDRGLSFYGCMERLWGKPAVGIGIAGIEGLEGQTKLDIDRFIKLTFGDLRGTAILYAALPGEVFLREGPKDVAKRLSGALLRERDETPPGHPVCPICGGDTFRFLPEGQLRCMLCSNSGNYAWRDGALEVNLRLGGHQLFVSLERAKEHLQWLRSMKDRFLESRKQLKAVTTQYLQVGDWIRPNPRGS